MRPTRKPGIYGMIGQSNRQTLPQRASVYFQCFMLPQSANVASLCQKFERVGYNLGYKSAAKGESRSIALANFCNWLEPPVHKCRSQAARDLCNQEQGDISGPNP